MLLIEGTDSTQNARLIALIATYTRARSEREDAMDGRGSSILILIASAYLGGAAALGACWPHGLLFAGAAAPFGGSLTALLVALRLNRRRAAVRNRPAIGPRLVQSEAADVGRQARSAGETSCV
ncbi:hypothetical protein ACRAWG_37310 [Methylobacterium sp. P31]